MVPGHAISGGIRLWQTLSRTKGSQIDALPRCFPSDSVSTPIYPVGKRLLRLPRAWSADTSLTLGITAAGSATKRSVWAVRNAMRLAGVFTSGAGRVQDDWDGLGCFQAGMRR
jgi:hypothetical protein